MTSHPVPSTLQPGSLQTTAYCKDESHLVKACHPAGKSGCTTNMGTEVADGIQSIKASVFRITNKRQPIPFYTYTIHVHFLEVVESAKYLGVYVDSKINFSTHTDARTKKFKGVRAFLCRYLSRTTCNIEATTFET